SGWDAVGHLDPMEDREPRLVIDDGHENAPLHIGLRRSRLGILTGRYKNGRSARGDHRPPVAFRTRPGSPMSDTAEPAAEVDAEVLIVGAGITGLYQLHRAL